MKPLLAGAVGGLALAAAALAPLVSSPARAQSGTVVVYTAWAEGVNAIAPRFKERTGLDIQVVAAGSGELVRRLQAESGRPLADAIVSVGGESIDASPRLFTAYEPAGVPFVPGIKTSANWTPFSVTLPTTLIVNTQLVPAAEIPTSWRDLADPKWKGRVAFAGADRSGSALQQLMQIVHNFGEQEGWALFERMFDNFVVTGSSSAVPRGVAQGEYAIGLTLEDSVQRFAAGGSPVVAVFPREGVTLNADAMAVVAGGPNPEGARRLIDFIASTEGQAVIQELGRRPIRTDMAPPANATPIASVPVNNFPAEWGNANSRAILDRYNRLARR
jgi:iron(III) transport system substrate-binding protein